MIAKALTRRRAIYLLSKELGIRYEDDLVEAPPPYLLAELVRKIVGDASARASTRLIYKTVISNRARRVLVALWPQHFVSKTTWQVEPEDPVSNVIELLVSIGDLFDVGRGYIMPSPFRLVPISGRQLIICGFPVEAFARQFNWNVEFEGVTRRTVADAIQLDGVVQWSVWNWLGRPPESTTEWTNAKIDEFRKSLKPSSQSASDIEVYLPRANDRQLQFFRWHRLDRASVRSGSSYLCRIRGYGASYLWGNVTRNDDNFSISSEAPVQAADVRRLQYGLDSIARAGNICMVDHKKTGTIAEFKNWLPAAELRLAIGLGGDVSKQHGRLPLRFRFATDDWPTMKAAIQALGMTFTNKG